MKRDKTTQERRRIRREIVEDFENFKRENPNPDDQATFYETFLAPLSVLDVSAIMRDIKEMTI